jgi:hypothetical protein
MRRTKPTATRCRLVLSKMATFLLQGNGGHLEHLPITTRLFGMDAPGKRRDLVIP